MAASSGPDIVDSGLVLALDAADRNSYPGSGTTWTDLSGRGNNGTLTNGPTYSSVNGGSIVFDGTNDYVTISNQTTSNFTLVCWLKTTATSLTGSFAYDGNGIMWSDVSGVANDFVFSILNNKVSFWTGDGGGSIDGTTSINTGSWFYITIIKDGTNSSKKIYVNTILEATGTCTANLLTANPIIRIGGNTLDNKYFNGNIATTQIYNRALSAVEIQQNFNAYRSRFIPPISFAVVSGEIVTSGLVLLLDAANTNSYSGSGTTWTDVSNNGNNGTLTNGPTYNSANGGSIVFDGADDYVIVSSNPSSIPYGSSARTVSIWFYTNTTTWVVNTNNLFFYGSGTTGNAFAIDFSTYPSMEVYTWGGGTNDFSFSTTYAQVGWKNITVTYNGATTILVYENGVPTQTFTLPSTRNTTTSAVCIGAINPSVLSGHHYDGRISNTSMYNRALTAAEVSQNFNALRGLYGI